MNPRAVNRQTVLIAIVAVLAGLAAVVLWQRDDSGDTLAETPGTQPATPETDGEAAAETSTRSLYFPGYGRRLATERRELPAVADTEQQVAAVVEALLAGPSVAGMEAPLPDGIQLRKVYLAEDGLAFIDFESPEGSPPPASGSLGEMLTVYSLVNTVLLNFEELERVVLLWNGRQLRTFAGHVDTMRPLSPKLGLIAATP